jgi:hypothetical protein
MTPERRAELRFRLGFSIVGLALTLVAVLSRGWPPPAAMTEIGVIGTLFFGGTAVWTARRLWGRRD